MKNPFATLIFKIKLFQVLLIISIGMITLFLLPVTAIEAQSSQQPQSLVAIEDPVLEKWMRGFINKPTGEITTSDWLAVTEVEIPNANLTSLTGLENATNLRRLNINENRVSDLSPLSALPRLQNLEIRDNLISDLSPLEGLPSLNYLYAWNNRITDVTPLNRIIPLKYAYLGENSITDISPLRDMQANLSGLALDSNRIIDATPLEGWDKLTYLSLAYNNIRDIEFVKNIPNLDNLSVQGNNITDLSPISNLEFLKYLYINDNNITDLKPLTNLQYLENLNISRTKIKDYSPLQNIPYLKHIDMYDNNVTDISFLAGMTFIEHINLNNNQITKIDSFRNLGYLEQIYLENNNISDISPLAQNGSLTPNTEINLENNPLSQESINLVSNLRARGLSVEAPAFGVPTPTPTPVPPTPTPTPPANAIIFENVEFESKIREMLGKDNTGYLLQSDIAKITEIKLDKVQFGHIRDIKHFTNLTLLELRGGGIYDLEGIGNLQKLETLDLSGNNLVNIQRLAQLKNLRTITLYNNQISDISSLTPVNLPKLSVLFLDGNNISELSPLMPSDGNLIEQLCCIGIGNNPIKTQNIDWAGFFPEKILTLQIGGLGFDDEKLKNLFSAEHGFPNLKYLTLINNDISDITPLLEIEGLGIDSSVSLRNNMIDESEFDNPIQTLIERGVNVNYDNQRSQLATATPTPRITSNAVGTCDNPGDWVKFADRALFESLIESMQDQGTRYCSDKSGARITRIALETVTYLDASDRGIRFLDGLDAATNLREAHLSGNMIGEFWPLDFLYNLEHLDLRDNGIFDAFGLFDMQGLTNLSTLRLDNNNLVTLRGVENLYNLEELYLTNNRLCQEGFDPFDALRMNMNLMVLAISNQQMDPCISDIGFVYALPNLHNIAIDSSNVNDLEPLSAMYSIEALGLADVRNVNDFSPLLGLNYVPGASINFDNSNVPEDIYRQLSNMGINVQAGSGPGPLFSQNMNSITTAGSGNNVIVDTSIYEYLEAGEGSNVKVIELMHNNDSSYSGLYNIEPYQIMGKPVYMKTNCYAGSTEGQCYIFKWPTNQDEWVLQPFTPGSSVNGNAWLANEILTGENPWNGYWGENVQSVRIVNESPNGTFESNGNQGDNFFYEEERESRGFLFNVDEVPEWAKSLGLNNFNTLLDPTVIAMFGIFITLLGTVAQMVRGR